MAADPPRRVRVRNGGVSIQMTAQAYAILDSFMYGMAFQEANLPAHGTGDEFAEIAQQITAHFPADEHPHLAELTFEHVLQPVTASPTPSSSVSTRSSTASTRRQGRLSGSSLCGRGEPIATVARRHSHLPRQIPMKRLHGWRPAAARRRSVCARRDCPTSSGGSEVLR